MNQFEENDGKWKQLRGGHQWKYPCGYMNVGIIS